MKHSSQVLVLFMFLFLLSQFIGLFVIASGSVIELVDEEIVVIFGNTSIGERPEISGVETIFVIAVGVLFGTLILLLLSRFNKVSIWKTWFFLASTVTMSVAFGVLFGNYFIAWVLALILSVFKVFRPNFFVHNVTELFIYAGIAFLFVPLINVFFAFILLILISIYDAYAVWRSKHMVTMAKFAKSSNSFPGLNVVYDSSSGKIVFGSKFFSNKNVKDNKKSKIEGVVKTKFVALKNSKSSNLKQGILGGGDIAFPLIFAGSFLVSLLVKGFSVYSALFFSFIISVFAGLALFFLFIYGKKDRYYPAMPFISAGCFFGYLVVILLLS